MGDFDADGDVDAADLLKWQGDFGENGSSDADNDGDSDGADFLAWQRQLGAAPPVVSANASVPRAGYINACDHSGSRYSPYGASRTRQRVKLVIKPPFKNLGNLSEACVLN